MFDKGQCQWFLLIFIRLIICYYLSDILTRTYATETLQREIEKQLALCIGRVWC